MKNESATTNKSGSKPHSTNYTNRICNLKESKDTTRDWSFADAMAAGQLGAPVALPQKVDLRQDSWKVGDQLTTGSCVGWATAEGVMRCQLAKANRLSISQSLSPRFVWMASKETDQFVTRPETFIEEAGTSLKAAMDIVKKYGVVLDTTLPFLTNTLMYTGNENAIFAEAASRRASSYYNLRRNLSQWKAWLAGNGPILAGLNVDTTWDNASNTGGKLDVFQPNTVRGGHAVCIVGYTTDRFIIRNSWGTSWGDKGFGYATPEYILGGFFDEAYGVTL